MTKEELYTAVELVNENIANDIRTAEETLSGDELTNKFNEIKFVTTEAELVGNDEAKENVITLCDLIEQNG
jgi:hypothetical protein